jgi:pilus assembly protein CpaF
MKFYKNLKGLDDMSQGYIIAVLGGKGGVGKSQVAANLAFSFAAEAKTKTLLLDFDQKACGDQNLITGLKSPKNLKELSEYPGAIDLRAVQQFSISHASGVSFISMPQDPVEANLLNVDGLGKFLKSVTSIFPLTVIDVGSDLNELAFKACDFSTMILLVTNADLLALNQTKRTYSNLISMMYPKDMIQIILNGAEKDHPVSEVFVSKTMEKPVLSVIPKDEKTIIDALSSRKPIIVAAKTSPFGKGITLAVQKLIQKNVLKVLSGLQKTPAPVKTEDGADTKGKSLWTGLKARIHKSLVEELDVSKSNENDPQAKLILKEKTKKIVIELLGKEDTKGILNTREDMNKIVKEILDEALGLGPLEDLLADKTVSEIMVVGPDKIFYEQKGKIKKSEIIFTNNRQVLNVIERIVSPIGRRIDEKTPYVDARLSDGSRVHAIIPPCALNGGVITIRKFPANRLTYKDLITFGSVTPAMADFLKIAVQAHRNIVVSGGTGSGKTSMINILGGFIQSNERIITCEDSAELDLPQDHIVRLETKPASLEGEGGVDIRCLVKQTLRMRPDRIIVGECRGGETLDMLQAMGTGHDGSLTTVHSNNPRECIGRLSVLVQYAGTGLEPLAIKEMISKAVHLVIQASRLDDGSRRTTFVTEIQGMQGETVTLQDIFTFVQESQDKTGKIIGRHKASGFIPSFIEKLEKKGINIPRGLFKNEP